MAKKVGIVTLYGLFNFGNRLQNYAVQEIFRGLNFEAESLIRTDFLEKETLINKIKKYILIFIRKGYYAHYKQNNARIQNFKEFQKLIISKKIEKDKILDLNVKYDYFSIGSDQVWNPFYAENLDWYFLMFCDSNKKIPVAPSIGINELPDDYEGIFKEKLNGFNYLSCREEEGSKIIFELTGKICETVVDPTMVLTTQQWDKVIKKPKNYDNKKYVLLYFLGELHDSNKKLLNKLESDGYEIINILDINGKYYTSGPSEFVWLIKNASLMITDSFHGCVFSTLYHTPFISFNRKGSLQMNSRINTLLKKFGFDDRMFDENIDYEKVFNQDFSSTDKILVDERIKFIHFLKNCMEE